MKARESARGGADPKVCSQARFRPARSRPSSSTASTRVSVIPDSLLIRRATTRLCRPQSPGRGNLGGCAAPSGTIALPRAQVQSKAERLRRGQMPRQMAKIRKWGMAGNGLPSSACQGGKLTLNAVARHLGPIADAADLHYRETARQRTGVLCGWRLGNQTETRRAITCGSVGAIRKPPHHHHDRA